MLYIKNKKYIVNVKNLFIIFINLFIIYVCYICIYINISIKIKILPGICIFFKITEIKSLKFVIFINMIIQLLIKLLL